MRSWRNEAWTVTTNKGTILDAPSMEAAEERLDIPIPEMIFGKSVVSLQHVSGWKLEFNALDALEKVDKTGKAVGNVQVAYSEEWRSSRQHNNHGHDVSKVHRPFDWTYSTDYKGTESQPPLLKQDETTKIPIDRLKQPKPILFFDEVPLFEDELGDNGLITFTGKVRVMATELLILVRMYLRVDDVLFRVRDTRVFVDFTTGQVVRNYVEKEGDFKTVKRRASLGAADHTQLLRDAAWIDSVLPVVKSETVSAAFGEH